MYKSLLVVIMLGVLVIIISSNLLKTKDNIMENAMTNNTTLVVTSSPNPKEVQALQEYVQGVMPLLLNLGGTIIKRSRITHVYHGKQSFTFLLVMDFPSKKALTEMFDSEEYQVLIPKRNRGFVDINILYAEDLK